MDNLNKEMSKWGGGGQEYGNEVEILNDYLIHHMDLCEGVYFCVWNTWESRIASRYEVCVVFKVFDFKENLCISGKLKNTFCNCFNHEMRYV